MSAELARRVRHVLGVDGDLTPLPGGHSGLTYTFAGHVIKAVPPGQRPVGRNDVLRQATILRALAGSPVPVPAIVAVDDRPPAWFAMELVPGQAIEPVLDEPAPDPSLAAKRMLGLAPVLRELHDIPRRPGWPPPDTAADELAKWSRTMRAVPEELRPGGPDLLRRLAGELPDDRPPALLHGDFRLGNVLCVDETPRAVVDWEIWSVGDPRVDLGWFLLFADHRNFPRLGRPVPGLPAEDELLAAYGDSGDLRWFRALSRMKMAAIMGHNLRRHREGKHHDPDQERLPPTIAALIRTGLELLS